MTDPQTKGFVEIMTVEFQPLPRMRPKQKRKSPDASKKDVLCQTCWLWHPAGSCDRDE